jgi:hypothetical protein
MVILNLNEQNDYFDKMNILLISINNEGRVVSKEMIKQLG